MINNGFQEIYREINDDIKIAKLSLVFFIATALLVAFLYPGVAVDMIAYVAIMFGNLAITVSILTLNYLYKRGERCITFYRTIVGGGEIVIPLVLLATLAAISQAGGGLVMAIWYALTVVGLNLLVIKESKSIIKTFKKLEALGLR